MSVLDGKALIQNRVDAIRAYHEQTGIKKAHLSLSGGIDSAVMAGLLVEALGRENVILDHTKINTDPKQTSRASRLAEALGVPLAIGDFTQVFSQITEELINSLVNSAPAGPWWGGPGLRSPSERLRDEIQARMAADPTIAGSIRSTLRAPLGRAYNRIMGGGIHHGTGNECEDRFLRFYQKGGDGEVDTNPIEMLSKTEVFQLAWALGEHFGGKARDAYREMMQATPSPDLWGQGEGHNDEDEYLSWTGAPFTYGRVDPETGKILRFGTIERVARFLDGAYWHPSNGTCSSGERLLFDDLDRQDTMQEAVRAATESGLFPGFTQDDILKLFRAARKAERVTRHKLNSNIPPLGERIDMLEDGILTNDLVEGKGQVENLVENCINSLTI